MGFWQAVRTAIFKKYLKFSGRASRSEFWWFMLFYVLCYIFIFALQCLASGLEFAHSNFIGLGWFIVNNVFLLVLFFPRIGITVRRLHDLNFSGWWSLILVGLAITIWMRFLTELFTPDFLDLYRVTDFINIYKVAFSILTFILLIVLIKKGDSGPNKYGENPVRVKVDLSVFS
ncbi:DUF805 domain-containing protein [Bartonella sp. HY406]|uniref:DUF805 domain-containing protein n=1 Tax=Bartonella sp. HY406 TaxID=2979331 RepID=UPI0021CA187A|nr:DUF805 domain-containing protein [Bartonella sp. HY406]UXN04144.1 DUF805 domain-containing protein [Bartonella sp. HY406]